MNMQIEHAPGPMIVMYGGDSCALHLAEHGKDTNAKNRILRLPRDGYASKSDPNVRFLRTLAAAPELLDVVRICLKAERERREKLLPGAPATTYTEDRIAKIEAVLAKVEA